MRSSNPVFSSLTTDNRSGQQGQAYPGADYQGYGRPIAGNQYAQQHGMGMGAPAATGDEARPMTVDDVITKTGITLGVIVAGAVITMALCLTKPGLGLMLTGVGAIGGLITVLVATFGKKYGSKMVTLIYAAFEGLFVGGISFVFTSTRIGGAPAFDMIIQAVIGTLGVFAGMLYAYKTGAIKVTDKTRRIITGGIIGVLVLAVGNMLLFMFTGHNPLTNGGPLAIVFSLVCIGLAAMSFLTDFDAADTLIRRGAPANYAWGVALGLAVTLVWLYTEILRLLSYFRN
ncbi:Bax inhibitor-1/YccA family protein [Corynebacterium mendelii]|uniref:Bax inhibitor-1/YccA family protein n=1 Tax=Corynebacterium mendelii TaxID=2765362 RepID=A0A939IW05_9CORY|nr:Bax inhibitor-1/YccA family protein [Corynebacterium mendelii]MBN9644781.1 Bax inhibitor-1/YccA family protein [Corynebacterium mendelii]